MNDYQESRFTVAVPVNGHLALFHTQTRALAVLDAGDWHRWTHCPERPKDGEAMALLAAQGFLVPAGTDEAAVFRAWKQQYVHDTVTLRSKVLVTRKCNNRCTYCILAPEAKRMTRKTALSMDRFYLEQVAQRGAERVRDDYLGGEPLLNPGVIVQSASRRFYFCQGRGVDYGFSITTNGTLVNAKVIDSMRGIGLKSVRVSLAGPAPVHDRLRPSATGGGTYRKILANLQSISGRVPIGIECQYDAASDDYRRVPEMLDDLARLGIGAKAIDFTPILARRHGKETGRPPSCPEKFLFLKKEAAKRGFPVDDEPPAHACMADFCAILVFDTDGTILPCPSLQGGEMAYGHVDTGIDFVAEAQLLDRRLPERCRHQCELLPVCQGGCRLQALVHSGDFNGIDCQYDTYRPILEDHVRTAAMKAAHKE